MAPRSNPPPSQPRPAPLALWTVVTILSIGILVNVGWGIASPPYLSGLRSHSDSNLSTLIVEEQETLRVRYGFAGYLHDLARGATLRVPDEGAVDAMLLENLAQVDVAVDDGYAPDGPGEFRDIRSDRRIDGWGIVATGGRAIRYSILVDGPDRPESLTYFVVGDDVYVIDDRLEKP